MPKISLVLLIINSLNVESIYSPLSKNGEFILHKFPYQRFLLRHLVRCAPDGDAVKNSPGKAAFNLQFVCFDSTLI